MQQKPLIQGCCGHTSLVHQTHSCHSPKCTRPTHATPLSAPDPLTPLPPPVAWVVWVGLVHEATMANRSSLADISFIRSSCTNEILPCTWICKVGSTIDVVLFVRRVLCNEPLVWGIKFIRISSQILRCTYMCWGIWWGITPWSVN